MPFNPKSVKKVGRKSKKMFAKKPSIKENMNLLIY